MNLMKSFIAGVALSSLCSIAMAAGNPLSVHVLNLQDGLPSPDLTVTLEKQQGTDWRVLNRGVTNEQGRITGLYPDGKALEKGTYRVTFQTGDWFKKHDTASFFPEVPVIFDVDGSVPHYHIPLLLSPYGFSTYRGS
jgi:5-hydroxyisourate hydrolase